MAANSIYLPSVAEIVESKRLTEKEKFFRIRISNRDIFEYTPGQFVEVSVFGVGEAPISITSSPDGSNTFELCVRAVGDLTNNLHKLDSKANIGIRGPFGNGFPIEELTGKDILFVAGGIGIIPLRSLIKYCLERRQNFGRIVILYGAKSPSELLFKDELSQWGQRDDLSLQIIVDRPDANWKGKIGIITELIPPLNIDPNNTVACIVGPPVMYKYVVLELLLKKIPEDKVILSLERKMKCGVGKCGHCQINSVYVCQDGPVFTYRQLKNFREAL